MRLCTNVPLGRIHYSFIENDFWETLKEKDVIS